MQEKLDHIAAKLYQGDKSAISSLLDNYYTIYYNYAYRIVGDATISKEIVLDTFTNIWINRSKLSKVLNFRSYIYTSIRNEAIDYIRKFRKENIESLADKYDSIIEIKENPENLIITKQELEKINDAINRLPPRCKEILYLVKEEKLKYKE
ncbi:MAG: sigma-70 family RNA polymerase sigma factor, partial [Rikenellaceae bacterium]